LAKKKTHGEAFFSGDLWLRRRRRRSPEQPKPPPNFTKRISFSSFFSRGTQMCKWFSKIPHRKSKTKRTKFKNKNSKTRFRANRDKLANQKVTTHQKKTNGGNINLIRPLNRPIQACLFPCHRGVLQMRFLHLFAWKMKDYCFWDLGEGV
jgi:hypothetical protein